MPIREAIQMNHRLFFLCVALLIPQIAKAQISPEYVTVIDPREHAFSIEVPKGWKADGGMFRSNMVDARPFVEMRSPDGRIDVRIGDASIPSYDLPNGRLQALHSTGPLIAPYATGDVFAAKYGEDRFKSMCQNPQVTRTGQSEPTFGRGNGSIKMTAGWAGFSCTLNGQPMAAFVYAETLLIEPTFGSAGHWYVITLGSVIAPTAEGMASGAILNHSYRSIALNPEWQRSQGQLIGKVRQGILNAAEVEKQINEAAVKNFQQNMHMQSSEVDNFNDVLLGQTYTRDTVTGQNFVAPAGNGSPQWIDPFGAIKESAMIPGPSYHQLENVSR